MSNLRSKKSDLFQQQTLRRGFSHTHHRPYITKMPPEIISRIFLECLPPELAAHDDNHRPRAQKVVAMTLSLSRVCHTWRDISHATPQLWTCLYINASTGDQTITNHALIVEQWFNRSGTALLLSFGVYNPSQFTFEMIQNPTYCAFVISIFSKYATRFRHLDLWCPTYVLNHLSDLAPSLVSLRTFKFRDLGYSRASAPVFPCSKYITHLSISCLRDQTFSINLPSLKHAVIHRSGYLNDYIQLIRNSPDLVSLKLTGVSPPDITPPPLEQPYVIGYNILKFEASTTFSDSDPVFDSITFPQMEEFTGLLIPGMLSDSTSFADFFKRSGRNLQAMTLYEFNIRDFFGEDDDDDDDDDDGLRYLTGDEAVLSLLASLPNLKDLKILQIQSPCFYRPKWLFRTLEETSRHPHHAPDSQQSFLPSLQSLTLGYITRDAPFERFFGKPWEMIPGLFSSFGIPQARPFNKLRILFEANHVKPRPPDIFLTAEEVRNIYKLKSKGITIDVGYTKKNDDKVALDILNISRRYHALALP